MSVAILSCHCWTPVLVTAGDWIFAPANTFHLIEVLEEQPAIRYHVRRSGRCAPCPARRSAITPVVRARHAVPGQRRIASGAIWLDRQRSGVQRQRDGEGAALARPRLHPDPPAVGLHQDAADVQAEAETGGSGVRPVEAIEEMRHVFGVDPGTRIPDGNSASPSRSSTRTTTSPSSAPCLRALPIRFSSTCPRRTRSHAPQMDASGASTLTA